MHEFYNDVLSLRNKGLSHKQIGKLFNRGNKWSTNILVKEKQNRPLPKNIVGLPNYNNLIDHHLLGGPFPTCDLQCIQCKKVFTKSLRTATVWCSPRCETRFSRHREELPTICRLCGQEKQGRIDAQYCSKHCLRRARTILSRGVQPEDYRNAIESQNFLCAICGDKPSTYFHTDHCHATGKFRGILCDYCNPALGQVNDNIDRIKKLQIYLMKPLISVPSAAANLHNDICPLCGDAFILNFHLKKFCGLKCSRRAGAIYQYNLTAGQYRLLLDSQNNKCASCSDLLADKPCVDHNHQTNNVRGILCHKCNKALGFFKENVDTMEKAIRYLKIHQGLT